MEFHYEATLSVEEVVNSSNNVSRELNEMIALCEARIIWLRGYADGKAAGTWVFDGNTQEEHFKRIQRGIEEGDPMYIDMLPSPRLGGEFADDPTWEDILNDEGIRYDSAIDQDGRDDLLREYQDAFHDGVQDEVMSYGKG
jgi:hypothetical protein